MDYSPTSTVSTIVPNSTEEYEHVTDRVISPAERYEDLLEKLGTISFFVVLTQCIIGLLGNSASLVVWVSGKKSSTLASSTYFKFLAAADVFSLVYRLFEVMGRPPVKASFTDNVIFCTIDAFLFFFTPQLSTWIIVCLSVERTLSLCFPLTFHTKGSRKRAKIAFLAIVIGLTAANLIRPFLCIMDHEALRDVYYEVIKLSGIYLLCVVPFVIITTCNVISVVKLCLLGKIGASDSGRQHVVTKLTKLSIGAGVLQCISIVPAMIYNIIAFHRLRLENLDFERAVTFQYVCDMVLYLNNTFDFLLYSFSSRDFRADFKELFCCRR